MRPPGCCLWAVRPALVSLLAKMPWGAFLLFRRAVLYSLVSKQRRRTPCPCSSSPRGRRTFSPAREQVFERNFLQHGIGSLAEKSQHAILKNYYCPNPAEQEINLGPFVADIANRRASPSPRPRASAACAKSWASFCSTTRGAGHLPCGCGQVGGVGGPADRRDGRPKPLPQKDGGLRHLPGAVQRAGPAVARRILGDHRPAGV